MTMRPGTIDPGTARRGMAAIVVAAVLLSVTGYAAIAANATRSVIATRSASLLATLQSDGTSGLGELTDRTVRAAIAAMPLDQRIANVGMAHDAKRGKKASQGTWLATLARLGWRDTLALQNMLYAAAQAGDLPRIMDISDAMLRRRQLMEQMIPMLSVVETDPVLRPTFITRLASQPSWRGAYLATTSQLQSRDRLIARFEMIRLLQRRGARLDQVEVVPNIIALDQADLPAYGFALWQSIQPHVTSPLDDQRFVLASNSYASGHDPVPYQWQLMTGQGFSVDASRDGSHATLSIDWDGRGVPVFAQQRTSAVPGGYALDVKIDPEEASNLSVIAFRLVCDGTAIPFQQVDTTRYVTASAVPCFYPLLQIAGDIQPSAATHRLLINQITMTSLVAVNR